MNRPVDDLASTVRTTITRYQMLTRGETVVAAVSGGPDSTALLHLLVNLRAEYDLTLVAAHLNHSFRGAEAECRLRGAKGRCAAGPAAFASFGAGGCARHQACFPAPRRC